MDTGQFEIGIRSTMVTATFKSTLRLAMVLCACVCKIEKENDKKQIKINELHWILQDILNSNGSWLLFLTLKIEHKFSHEHLA